MTNTHEGIWTEITVSKYMTEKEICVEYRRMSKGEAEERVLEIARALPGCRVQAIRHSPVGTAVIGITLKESRELAAADTFYRGNLAAKRLRLPWGAHK